MSWNHRVIKKGECLAIHEVHYKDDGSISGHTEMPKSIYLNEVHRYIPFVDWG